MRGGQRPYALDLDIRTFDEHYFSGVLELVSAGSMINLSNARSFGAAPAQGILVSIKNLTPQVKRVAEVWLVAP